MITTDQIDRLRRNMQPNNQKALRGNPHAPAFPRRFVGAGVYEIKNHRHIETENTISILLDGGWQSPLIRRVPDEVNNDG